MIHSILIRLLQLHSITPIKAIIHHKSQYPFITDLPRLPALPSRPISISAIIFTLGVAAFIRWRTQATSTASSRNYSLPRSPTTQKTASVPLPTRSLLPTGRNLHHRGPASSLQRPPGKTQMLPSQAQGEYAVGRYAVCDLPARDGQHPTGGTEFSPEIAQRRLALHVRSEREW